MSAKLDSINILTNEMYRRPETENTRGLLLIKNEGDYLDFVGHPKTVKIFRTEISMIGESTFSEIFVNCDPK
jgi:hypothetical protein